MNKPRTIAVVGGGSAGFTAARTARDAGARVLFFLGDKAEQASLCINEGCMPSKALFAPIDEMHQARRHPWLRVEPRQRAACLAQVVAFKDRLIAEFRAYRHLQIQQLAGPAVEVVPAHARFMDPHTLVAAGRQYAADAVILATGSQPRIPPLAGWETVGDRVWTNTGILHNTVLPDSLAVIGGGPVGLEFALRYARLGVEVSLVTREGLLSQAPPVFGQRLARIFEQEGVRILTGHNVCSLRCDSAGWFILETDNQTVGPLAAQRVLLATGRVPCLQSLNLPAAGIEVRASHQLKVAPDLRVAGQEHVFAVGDLLGGAHMVVHQAHRQAIVAAHNAVRDQRCPWSSGADLQVVFTDPEFAHAGLTPAQAADAGRQSWTVQAQSRDVGKLMIAGDTRGLGQLVVDRQTRRILGAGLLCAGASDLIHLLANAIVHQQSLEQLAANEWYHPTQAEMIAELLARVPGANQENKN